MAITASQLRANVYNLIDQVIETGEPLEIERKGVVVRLVPSAPVNKLDRLTPMPGLTIDGDIDDLIYIDWSSHWSPDDN